MLEKLLERITRGGAVSLSELARDLDVSLPMLEAMVAELVRAGYLREVGRCSPSACQGCGEQAGCTSPRAGGRVWVRTDRP